MEKEMEKYFADLKKELFGTIHEEKAIVIETVTDIRIVLKDWIIVLDKISSRFSILKKEFIFGEEK